MSSFIPRPTLRQTLLQHLESTSVLLHGARRIGKSTLLQQIVDRSPHGVQMVRIDLEGFLADPVEQLAAGLHDALARAGLITTAVPLAQRIESIEVAGAGVGLREAAPTTAWARIEADLRAASESLGEGRLLVALDEVPWWLDAIAQRAGPGEARAALATLRRIRQTAPLSDRLRMVLTGSIGLAGLASALDASAELNDLVTLTVPPMTDEEGSTLFETEVTARGGACRGAPARHAARLAGGSPHWIKVLAAEVGADATVEAVDAAVEALLVPAQRRLFADEGQEHFRRRHPDLFPVLVAVLDQLSGADDDLPLEAAVTAALSSDPGLTRRRAEECVWLLTDGFYLEVTGDRVRWVNPLFRRWWSRYGGE